MVLSPSEICSQIISSLKPHIDPRRVQYNKEEDRRTPNINNHEYLGVKTPINREIANKFYKVLKNYGISDIDAILEYCNFLLEKKISELRLIAFQWSFKLKRQYRADHFSIFKYWILNYLSGWASTDDFCTHTAAYHLMKFPQFASDYLKLVHSDNPWVRRASAVVFIVPVRKKKLFELIFRISDELMFDGVDLVLKGYGWLLKEATKHYQQEVFDYVVSHKQEMPRVALRYAIEKLPKNMKDIAMKK